MSADARRLLFVCAGNTCRSPMARFLAERLARREKLPWTAASAGVSAAAGAPLTPGAARALAGRGIAGVRHAARPLTEAEIGAADAVYTLTRDLRDAVVGRFPGAAAKTAVLRAAAGFPDADVADPLGGSDADYERCAARIEEALVRLIQRSSDAECAG